MANHKARISRIACICVLAAFCLLAASRCAWATQEHDAPEGMYAHQLAHAFFIISMGSLIYWLRGRGLVKKTGWRLIQYAAIFFILFNLDAMLAHYVEGRGLFETVGRGSPFAVLHMVRGPWELGLLSYVVRLDHLLCLPGIIFLYAGLRQLLLETDQSAALDSEI